MSRCGHLRRGSVGRMEGAEERPGEATEAVFSIPHIVKGFTVPEGGQLALAGYLESWTEFAARDVSAKVGILEKYLHGTNGEHYSTVQSMIIYERDNDLLTSSDRPSGARTLLRLHRALDYASEFVKELGNTSAENNFGRRVSEIYLSTLGRFNNKILAKTVSGLLLLLPPRKTMLQRIARGNTEVERELLRQFPMMSESMSLAYNKTQQIYEEYNILDLP
ncbi:ceramide-1-phosphate transfer protein isoform X3 [Procambarus clarkii]|uniref:ceramide-1-phosphate transfer protein isoform X3 n=1 Tax=Procambarus clarkii TaxID=6728 RepID=UPI00374375B3